MRFATEIKNVQGYPVASMLIFAFALVFLLSCAEQTPVLDQPSSPVVVPQTYSYVADVKPILEQKCIACHGCYDAPCQLKLTSGEGLARGATKKPVYSSSRLLDAAPTRLFTDAQTTLQWREKEFFSVLNEQSGSPEDNLQYSLLYSMIKLGRNHPLLPDSAVPEDIELGLFRNNECPTLAEFDHYAKRKPQQGMPLAITGLGDTEYDVLQTWIAEGAVIDEMPSVPTAEERARIQQWEAFFNQTSLKGRLVGRYLYEHLFLAHLYFSELEPGNYFELVRSASPPGSPIDIIATAQPNDDPGQAFYYRLRKINSTIVHKTHIVYPLNEQKQRRFNDLFMAPDWEVAQLPGYSSRDAENPFKVFSAIPARSRYQFLLDNAHYFVMTFIRGPVCRGQVATDVIDDQFYVLFQDPDADLSVTDRAYLEKVEPYLSVAGRGLDILPANVDLLHNVRERNKYIRLRGEAYRQFQPDGPELASIWDGDGQNTDAMLTIFRHFDSAAVVKGFVGAVPKTLWVMDFPILERTYYTLVVNYNVFGRLGHQAGTRLYFDLIRTGAENNFLHFMPSERRAPMRESWYQGSAAELKSTLVYEVVNEDLPVQIEYRSNDPKAEFVSLVSGRLSAVAGPRDVLNRCAQAPCYRPGATEAEKRVDAVLQGLTSTPATVEGMDYLRFMPDAAFLRVVTGQSENDLAYTLIRNKAHSNVAFMFDEGARRERNKDTLTAYPGLLGSYPNFFFVVPLSRIEAFGAALHGMSSRQEFVELINQYGIRRTHPRIWEHFSWFVDYMRREQRIEAGIYDLNRYNKVSQLTSDLEN
jgi:hypothetical protein